MGLGKDRSPELTPTEPVPGWKYLQTEVIAPVDLIQQRRLDEAEALLMKQVQIQPRNRKVLTELAQLSEVRGNLEEALQWWTSIRIEPDRRWEVDIHRIRLIARLGQRQVAKPMFLKIIQGHKDNAGLLFASTNLIGEFDEDDRKELLPLIRQRLVAHEEKNGETAQTLQARAKIATLDEQWQEALQCIRKALLIRPQDQHLQHLVAEAAKRAGETLDLAAEEHST